ncbi:hypothetical protein GIB67_039541 [Kingdonia uniflora]|uniref:Myb/SANT-like domain-containing protein n=1 Tax=Kingdonia uniflora TaxID=39325 RepID=A0A7J7LIW4_9MAGN|nr:hypothetical protein GIB67_039541 [Kingdonia uniflora]
MAKKEEAVKYFTKIIGSGIWSVIRSFTMPPKNRKAQQEVTGDPSQDTPKHAKQLNGEMLYTYLVLCKRELDTSKDAGSGLSKASWAKIREEYNAKFNLTRGPKYFSNVWFNQKAKYSAWTWLLRRTGNNFNAETGTFHLPPEEWDALIKINGNVSTFRKGGLLHEELMESIFATRVATGRYATGPARDDFIDTATSDVAADLNLEDENVPTEKVDFIEDTTDTYYTDYHFEPFQAKHSFPQTEQYTPNHFGQSAPQPMQSASHSENSRRSGKNKRKVDDTLDKLDQLIEVLKTQGEQEGLAKQDTREKKLSEVLGILQEMHILGYLTAAEMTKACFTFTQHLDYADMFVGLVTLELKKLYLM